MPTADYRSLYTEKVLSSNHHTCSKLVKDRSLKGSDVSESEQVGLGYQCVNCIIPSSALTIVAPI